MPAIQDGYSVHVSNRFALAINDSEQDYESDSNADFDPIEQLRLIQEKQKQERESKKKNKKQVDTDKTASTKEVQFKENKSSNVPSKKQTTDSKKDEKVKFKKDSSKEFSGKSVQSGDRQPPPGDENRRPHRQNNQRRDKQPPRDKGGDGDRFGNKSFNDAPDRHFKRGPGNADGEERVDGHDRGGSRYERYRGSRGGFRGSRGGSFGYRNNFRNDGRDDRGKREFDRRSGSAKSGVRPTDKRDGGGPRNWGTPGNEIEDVVEQIEREEVGNWADQVENEEQAQEKQTNVNAEGDEKKEEAGDDALPTEQETSAAEMTLDEYKKMQAIEGRKKKFNIRRPGEGEDSGKWKGMKMIHDSTTVSKPIHHHVHDDAPRKAQSKSGIDVDIRFDTPPRSSRGGRGGRGFRGGSGRGSYRGGGGQQRGGGKYGNRSNSQVSPPDVLNEKEFPTLPAA